MGRAWQDGLYHHMHDCHLELIHVRSLVRFGDMSFAIDAACSATGLNQCVTANQA